VDLAGVVRRAATTVITFAGLETYSLDFGRPVEVEVQGTDGDDVIEFVGGQYDAKLGAGRDLFVVGGYEFSGTIDAGEGTDAIWALDPARIIIDLGKQGAVAMGGETFGVDNFEDAVVLAYRVEVHGSRAVNTLDLSGCIVHGYGRGGDDLLVLGKREYEVACTRRNLNLDGGRGADRLIGSNLGDLLSGGKGSDVLKGLQGRDELLGGAGGDKTDGGAGSDKCEAEVKVRCEVKVPRRM
jgi:Ca2+-binding RTX toxin-like protein